MNWKKAKTILILVFIFVNIFLLFMYKMNYTSQNQYNKNEIITILSNNNLRIEDKLIKDYGKTVESLEINNFIQEKENIAQIFLGDNYQRISEEKFQKENRSVGVYDIAFEYINSDPNDKNFDKITEFNASNKILNALEHFGFSKEHLSVMNVTKNNDGSFKAVINYNFLKMSIFNNYLHIVASEKGISKITGSYLTLTQNNKYTHDIIPCEEILIEFTNNPDLVLSSDPSTITGIQLGYFLPNEIMKTTDAIPCYEITLSNGKVYYYDARLNVSRVYRYLNFIKDLNEQL